MKSIPQKCCFRCGKSFPATPKCFFRNKGRYDGLADQCKACKLQADKEYHNRPNVKEKLRTYYRERARRERKDPLKLERRRYVNREHMRRKYTDPQYRELNKRRLLAWLKTDEGRANQARRASRYGKTEKGRRVARVAQAKRRAYKLKANGSYTKVDIEAQIQAQTDNKGKLHCWWCNKVIKGKYHVDHRIPLSRGGSNDARNIVIAHGRCNQSKGNKLPHE